MAITDYNPSASANVLISGIDIAENCARANVNNAIRQLMADLAAMRPGIAPYNTIGAIAAATFTVGDVFRSSLYGGSTWVVKASVELQPDYYGTITAGVNSSIVDFTDELHVVTNKTGGGTCIAECQLGSIMGYVRQLATKCETDVHARLSQSDSLATATAFAVFGDSVAFGQYDSATDPGVTTAHSPTFNGTATGFGDGSTHAHNCIAAPYPDVLSSFLTAVYGTDSVSMTNRGYSGDRVGIAYRRHRTGPGQRACIIDYGRNDVLYATVNGTDQVGVFSAIASPNDFGGYILATFVDAYRKFVYREVLRNSMVVLVAPGPYISASGYNGTTYAAAQIQKYWSWCIEAIGEELGLAVIREKETVGYFGVNEVTHDGIHPNDFGANYRAARYAPYFMGGGLKAAARVCGTRMLTANKLIEPVSGFAGIDNATTANTANANSFAAPAITGTNAADQNLGSGGGVGTIYYTVLVEEDLTQVMPVGYVSASATITYNLNFGSEEPVNDTLPRARLTIDPSIARGTRTQYRAEKTLSPGGATDYNDPSDISSHLTITTPGLHVVGITCTSGAFVLEGLLFGDFAAIKARPLEGSATYDPASLNDGVGATTTVTVTGAALGDFAEASFSNDLQGILLTAWVSSANTVSVRFQNESTGTLDLASGTLRARVRKA